MAHDLLRVVVVRRGKVKPTEFQLRPGERGLSLFRASPSVGPDEIVAAIRAAGKQGELGVAELPAEVFRRLHLRIVRTPGGTPVPEVNACHLEARPTVWRRLFLGFRGVAVHDWFNEQVAPVLAAEARILE